MTYAPIVQVLDSSLFFVMVPTGATTGPISVTTAQGSASSATNFTVLGTSVPANTTVTYLHTDHLGAPRAATNQSGQVVWRWEGTAFGDTLPNEYPEGDGKKTTINLRQQNMYCDKETNLCIVGDRYYDPATGRWITADRMSVAQHVQRWRANLGAPNQPPLEINPYATVANNPLRWIDPTGEAATDKLFGLPKQFWNWYHKRVKRPGDQDLTKEEARDLHEEWRGLGKPKPDSKGKQSGFADPLLLQLLVPWWMTPSEIGIAECELPGGPACKPEPKDCK